MGELRLVASMARHLIDEFRGSAMVGKALTEWAESNASWLAGTTVEGVTIDLAWLDAAIARAETLPDESDRLADLAATLGAQLELDDFDRRLLTLALLAERRPRANALAKAMARAQVDMAAVLAVMAGASNGAAARASLVMRLGLFEMSREYLEAPRIETTWRFDRLLDRGIEDGEEIVTAMVGARQRAMLPLDAFPQAEHCAGLLVGLLRGAAATRAPGVNILIHGPPGTGKTEFARSLAAAAGTALFAVGEHDFDGEEPSREDRVGSLNLGQRAFAARGNTVLLFDEFEDMIGDAAPSAGDFMRGRQGSKVFVNRMLETNRLPVIWTSNAIDNVDPAILRRMSFVLHMKQPSGRAARQVLARIAADEGVAVPPALDDLVARAPQAASVARVAIRSAKLAGGDGAVSAAESLVRAISGPLRPVEGGGRFDPALVEADTDIVRLLDRVTRPGGPRDFSLLLTGPPGTGKTALAHHLAQRLDRPLIAKRASDLLSKWVGGTEANIADAFAEAREEDAVLLFDEIDSILADRSGAQASWEVSQVNELLTWFERHPLPFVAATNHAAKLDPAAMRRFVFKLELRALSPARAAQAFERQFGVPAPQSLAQLHGVTPGDLAVVARGLRFADARPEAEALVALVAKEVASRPEGGGRIGF
ncbi:MAG: AAA family ATPase [Sphingomonas sp.]|uniref:AAA family ATPase n=1 Tax=Sphingomonas sp. TaxID=28214 RepID=UPI003F7DDB27